MIAKYKEFMPFTLKLKGRISKGILLEGEEKSFDSAAKMAEWWENKRPSLAERKREKYKKEDKGND